MNNESFDKLVDAASKKLGTSPENLRETLVNDDIKALSARLSKQDKARLRAILADEQLMARLKAASSPEELAKILGGK